MAGLCRLWTTTETAGSGRMYIGGLGQGGWDGPQKLDARRRWCPWSWMPRSQADRVNKETQQDHLVCSGRAISGLNVTTQTSVNSSNVTLKLSTATGQQRGLWGWTWWTDTSVTAPLTASVPG